MPDISMCRNLDCPIRDLCYRYRAIPDYYQAVADFKFDKVYLCDAFWPVADRKDLMPTKYIDKEIKRSLKCLKKK